MEKELFEFLNKEVPNSLRDIREVLDLLVTTMDGTIDEIGKGVSECYNNKDFEKSIKFVSYSKEVDELNKKVQDILLQIDNILDENEEDDISQNTEKQIPNYSDFLVDSKQEHTLYEDFTHTRPCAFKIEGTRVEIKDWKGVLVQTINYLAKKDPNIVRSFVDDSKMNGKKVIYFSRVKLPTMRAVVEIKSVNIYVATNLSANGIRNLLIKMLNKYNIKLSDYKIYLKADYSELH